MQGDAWIRVGAVGDFEESRPRVVSCGDEPVFVCRIGERYFSAVDRCSHADYPLSDGDVDGCTILCPLHGATFDLETGMPLTPPADLPIRTLPTRVEGDSVYVSLDPLAGSTHRG